MTAMNTLALDLLKHFVSIKSISTQDEYLPDMEQARHFLADLFRTMGFSVHILPGAKHAAVFAQKIINQKLPTVLIYGLYDVQPPDPIEGWETLPFEPTVKGGCIYARGVTDNKGQVMVHVMAVRKLLDLLGENLPVNFKFIVEGEEEIGSVSVDALVKTYKDDLLHCDYVLVSDSEMVSKDQPAIDISLRGLVYTEVIVRTAGQDLHSGQFGGVAENPAQVLVRMINQLKTPDNHVNVPHFYDNLSPLTSQEQRSYQSLHVSKEQLMKEGRLLGIGGGEQQFSLNERRWSQPTLDINGLLAGYIGEGSKTIIPATATAKISIRLAANQNPEQVYRYYVNYLKSIVPENVKMKIVNHAHAWPYRAPTDHPIFDLVKLSLKTAFGKEPVFQGVGGSIGFIPVMANTLKVPCVMVGFGLPDDNLHAPNEHYSLHNYYRGIEAMSLLYKQIATLTTSGKN